jgi:DNA polymerase III psi subunit
MRGAHQIHAFGIKKNALIPVQFDGNVTASIDIRVHLILVAHREGWLPVPHKMPALTAVLQV